MTRRSRGKRPPWNSRRRKRIPPTPALEIVSFMSGYLTLLTK